MEETPDPGEDTAAGGGTTAVEEGSAQPDRTGGEGPGGGVPRTAVLVGVVAVAVIALVIALLRGGEDTAKPSPTPTTTTTIAPREPGEVVVATARNPEILVQSSPPDDWDGSEVTIATPGTAPPEESQDTTPARPPLPRIGFPVEGRRAEPGGWRFTNPTSFDEPFTMLVTEGRGDWLRVEVPVRPNGTPGWVRASDVKLSRHHSRVEINRGTRTLRAWDGDELIAETPVVIGTDATRTPTGRFYLTDKVPQEDPGAFYGPIVLALNAYSEQLDTFDGGVPVIAVHGTNRPEQVGQAISNGCIRVPNDVITLLAERLPLGTQVDVVP